MNQQQVIDLMKSSKTHAEWNTNCDKVKRECGGYPEYWYRKSYYPDYAIRRWEQDPLLLKSLPIK